MMAGALTSGVFGHLADYFLWWTILLSILVHTWCFFRYFPRKRRPRLGLLIGNLLIFLCMAGFLIMVAETYLRFTAVWTDSFGVSLPARRWFALHTKLNSLGCRDPEWNSDKPPGVRRIAFVGDSFTYGWGVEQTKDRFPDRLQTLFDKRTPGRVQVMNVAKPGWGTGDELQPVADMIERYRVDEIVLCYVPNDIEKLLPRTDEFNPIRPPESGFWNLDSSCLLDLLYRRVYLPRVPTVRLYHDWLSDGFSDPIVWQRHSQQLRDIIRRCRESNTTLRVVLLPFLRTGGTRFNLEKIHSQLAAFLQAESVLMVDLIPAIRDHASGELVVNALDPHPNAHAHDLFAAAIWSAFYSQP